MAPVALSIAALEWRRRRGQRQQRAHFDCVGLQPLRLGMVVGVDVPREHRQDRGAERDADDAQRHLVEPVGVLEQRQRALRSIAAMAVGIGDGMELGVHTAFGAADQAPETPLFTARLDAVRCAFR